MSEEKELTKDQRVERLVSNGFITAVLAETFKKLSNDDLDAFYAEQVEFKKNNDLSIQESAEIEKQDYSELSLEDKESLYKTLKAELYPDELTSAFEQKYHDKVVELRQLKQKFANIDLDKIKLAAEAIIQTVNK